MTRSLTVAPLMFVLTFGALAADRYFLPALPGYKFEFPRDHFSHPDYKTEWWYYTGNMKAADGSLLGFELTFFREGVANGFPNPSKWRIDNLYFAHLAVTNLARESFRYAERMQRGALGMSGATPASLGESEAKIWVGDWRAVISATEHRLDAAGADLAVELDLRTTNPPVIHGVNGVSDKGIEAGDASHYYSFPNLAANGTIRFEGRSYPVSGAVWMDHEFFTSPRPVGQSKWDWFCLRFDDGSALMVYDVRGDLGAPFLGGTFIAPDGAARALTATDFSLAPAIRARWHSPHSGGDYPLEWQVKIKLLDLDLRISPDLVDQELSTGATTGVTYWEGMMHAVGKKQGADTFARGYMELTGYAR